MDAKSTTIAFSGKFGGGRMNTIKGKEQCGYVSTACIYLIWKCEFMPCVISRPIMNVDQTDADVISAYAGQRIDINYAIAIYLKRSEFMANLILWSIKNKTRKA